MQDRKHVNMLTLSLEFDGKERLFDLRLNTDLLAEGFQRRYQHQGGMKEYNPGKVVRFTLVCVCGSIYIYKYNPESL